MTPRRCGVAHLRARRVRRRRIVSTWSYRARAVRPVAKRDPTHRPRYARGDVSERRAGRQRHRRALRAAAAGEARRPIQNEGHAHCASCNADHRHKDRRSCSSRAARAAACSTTLARLHRGGSRLWCASLGSDRRLARSPERCATSAYIFRHVRTSRSQSPSGYSNRASADGAHLPMLGLGGKTRIKLVVLLHARETPSGASHRAPSLPIMEIPAPREPSQATGKHAAPGCPLTIQAHRVPALLPAS